VGEIRQCEIITAADLEQFRCQTLLIFHNPVAKRAFGGGQSPPTAAKPP
jgi:hypothetical protein